MDNTDGVTTRISIGLAGVVAEVTIEIGAAMTIEIGAAMTIGEVTEEKDGEEEVEAAVVVVVEVVAGVVTGVTEGREAVEIFIEMIGINSLE